MEIIVDIMFLFYLFKLFGAFIIWTLSGFRGDLEKIVDDKKILCQVVSGTTLIMIIALTIYY